MKFIKIIEYALGIFYYNFYFLCSLLSPIDKKTRRYNLSLWIIRIGSLNLVRHHRSKLRQPFRWPSIKHTIWTRRIPQLRRITIRIGWDRCRWRQIGRLKWRKRYRSQRIRKLICQWRRDTRRIFWFLHHTRWLGNSELWCARIEWHLVWYCGNLFITCFWFQFF